MPRQTNKQKQLLAALETVVKRNDRDEHPEGTFDNKKRWYPSAAEKQSCCQPIRTPSELYPYSLMAHCRSVRHIAHLMNVDSHELQKAVRATRQHENRE